MSESDEYGQKPPRPNDSVRFHRKLEELARTDGGVPRTERYPGDRLRLVVKDQLVVHLTQPLANRARPLILSGLNVRSQKFTETVEVTVKRISHCNPNLVLLEGDDVHLLTGDVKLRYSPGTDTPPPTVGSSSANDVGYSPGTDTPPPTVGSSSGNGSGTPRPIVPASFDSQLRRILANSAHWKTYPIVAVMDTGIDFAYPNTATIPIQHNGGHPMCGSTIEPDYIGWDFVHDQNDPFDDDVRNKHGSRIAAIISKALDHKVKILPLKVISNQGIGTLFDIFCGFEYLLSSRLPEKPKVINASWGFYCDDENTLMTDYIHRLHRQGMWLVNAAGNRGDIKDSSASVDLDLHHRYPARYSESHYNVVTITSVGGRSDLDYFVIENYSPSCVNVGIGCGEDAKFLESLVDDSSPGIEGSSYATPVASALVAMKYLVPFNEATRDTLLTDLPNNYHVTRLVRKICNGLMVPWEVV